VGRVRGLQVIGQRVLNVVHLGSFDCLPDCRGQCCQRSLLGDDVPALDGVGTHGLGVREVTAGHRKHGMPHRERVEDREVCKVCEKIPHDVRARAD
jgi:hypothetical protein